MTARLGVITLALIGLTSTTPLWGTALCALGILALTPAATRSTR